MLRIDNTIFSFDILEKKFRCNITACKGNCCKYGDSGAPLTPEETVILENIIEDVRPYLREEGLETIRKQGTSILDFEIERVTPLINNMECAYTIIRDDVYLCGIEQAWADGKVKFRKPLSCHLYPIRVKQYTAFRAINYDEQPVCSTARTTGMTDGIYAYQFLKEPLIRAIGEQMYDELCIAAKELRKSRKIKR